MTPQDVNIYQTVKCNFKCTHCMREYKDFSNIPDVTPKIVSNTLNMFPTIRSACIAGFGEPLISNEVINVMKRQNYHLAFKSAYIATVFGQEREIPQDNFEEQYRLGHTCSLLFAKRNSYD